MSVILSDCAMTGIGFGVTMTVLCSFPALASKNPKKRRILGLDSLLQKL
jgi:hypothetical protein